ncbi:DUF6896 domain-containing protein [Deinococcus navajonensis]|uniref:DUF6896 domain-containing protein n=1 Tax=Deinococcus navajonensis TaxID=309884 RepID=A0ABV8XSC6_9DEIO
MNAVNLEDLLQHYLTLVQDAIRRIEARYGVATPGAVWSGHLPAVGCVDGMSYQYHGRGCTAVLDGQTVSWDWWDGRTDLLDPWQIARLTGDRPEAYGEWADLRVLRQHMQTLAEQGLLEPVVEGHSYQLPPHQPTAVMA